MQAFRHVAIDDALGQTFDDRGLADPGLADQNRVVLGAARQHLDGATNLFIATDHRIDLALAGSLSEVARIFLERVIGVLGRRTIGGAALAQRLDRGVEVLRRYPRAREDLAGFGIFFHRQRQQQALDRHKAVARLVGHFFGGRKDPAQARIEVKLTRAPALDLRPLARARPRPPARRPASCRRNGRSDQLQALPDRRAGL